MSPGDSLNNTNINNTTQEFANETSSLNTANFRDQGLDTRNFKRGCLNIQSGKNNPNLYQQDTFDINKKIAAKDNGPHETIVVLTSLNTVPSPHLNLNKDVEGFREHSIIVRYGFDCFIDWFGKLLYKSLGGQDRSIRGESYLKITCENTQGITKTLDVVHDLNIFYIKEKHKMIRFGRASYPTQTAFDITDIVASNFSSTTQNAAQEIEFLRVDLIFKFTQGINFAPLIDEFNLVLLGNLQVSVLRT